MEKTFDTIINRFGSEMYDKNYHDNFLKTNPNCKTIYDIYRQGDLQNLSNLDVQKCLDSLNTNYDITKHLKHQESLCRILDSSAQQMDKLLKSKDLPNGENIVKLIEFILTTIIPTLENLCKLNQVEIKLSELLISELNRKENYNYGETNFVASKSKIDELSPQLNENIDLFIKKLQPDCYKLETKPEINSCLVKKIPNMSRAQIQQGLQELIINNKNLCSLIQQITLEGKTAITMGANVIGYIINSLLPTLYQTCLTDKKIKILIQGSEILKNIGINPKNKSSKKWCIIFWIVLIFGLLTCYWFWQKNLKLLTHD